jgi:hypothetical protein
MSDELCVYTRELGFRTALKDEVDFDQLTALLTAVPSAFVLDMDGTGCADFVDYAGDEIRVPVDPRLSAPRW